MTTLQWHPPILSNDQMSIMHLGENHWSILIEPMNLGLPNSQFFQDFAVYIFIDNDYSKSDVNANSMSFSARVIE